MATEHPMTVARVAEGTVEDRPTTRRAMAMAFAELWRVGHPEDHSGDAGPQVPPPSRAEAGE